jgi:hypothetical protein
MHLILLIGCRRRARRRGRTGASGMAASSHEGKAHADRRATHDLVTFNAHTTYIIDA